MTDLDPDLIALYDYPLAGVRIASTPSPERDAARLLVHERATGRTRHRSFRDLPEILAPGDLLVVNDARVVPARLRARRKTGAEIEVLLHPTGRIGPDDRTGPAGDDDDRDIVVALLQPSARVKAGERLTIEGGEGGEIEVLDPPGGELRRVRLAGGLAAALRAGHVPLPPYLPREAGDGGDAERALDRERYQTIFAERPGAIAAPTAGLHFTPPLLERLEERGIATVRLTLWVGPATFLPVRTERLSDHAMQEERFEISAEAAKKIAAARARGSRVVAIGTTTTRALESAAASGSVEPGLAHTRLLIRPPYSFRAVDALVTNFHLPKSTLLALVSAFAGRERVLALYEEAARLGYRFYSYGDAMLLL